MIEKTKLLYIDDELNNLNSFKASFRFNYQIFTAISVAEAIKIIESEKDIHVVISDQRMPDKNGVDFFEELRYTHPDPVRMLITGFTDIEDVINAINKGHIFRYIKKPWSDEDIISAIEEAKNYYLATSLLRQRNEELQTAYNALDKFAYSVTHDLKGPIISSKALLNLIKNETNETTKLEMIDLMSMSFEKLDAFVDSIFDYYKIKQGELLISEIDFDQLIADQKAIHGMTLRMNEIDFTFSIHQKMPFYSDPIKLRIILYNLIENACKYQNPSEAKKSVTIEIVVEDAMAKIVVKDNGIGIPEKYRDRIFEIFYRATSVVAGSGIGLYNVKDAITKLNGNIEVISEVQKGSTFIITIPSKIA